MPAAIAERQAFLCCYLALRMGLIEVVTGILAHLVTESNNNLCLGGGALNDAMQNKEKEERKVMKGNRFLLFRRIECMNEDSRKLLDELLSLNKPLSEAFLLKEGFRKFLNAETFRLAAAGFRKWILMARKSTLQPFKNLATTLTRNRRQVLHTLRYGLSSGRIEGVNSMISRILHKARGIPSIGYLRVKLRQRMSPDFARLI